MTDEQWIALCGRVRTPTHSHREVKMKMKMNLFSRLQQLLRIGPPPPLWYRCWIPGDGYCYINQAEQIPYLERGLYQRPDGHLVCFFCQGNCGQCGTSVGRGVNASMSAIAVNLVGGEKKIDNLIIRKELK
jgi:hypothetical protein